MPATIDDVAHRAKVSISTVSRVVNRPHLVNETTRQRVERAIQQLDYRPNVHAQGLMRSRSDLVALGVTPSRS
jgi:DNA-binding LacI/PurR family transcriptional regulator